MTTLPVAQKVIADKPPKNSVVSPTIKADQEADVDRKMRLYGVVQAFRNGRMPDNTQIDETLLYVRDHSPINTQELSADGKQLVDDTRELIETARRFVAEKNADEIVQQFLSRTSGIDMKEKKPSIDASVSEKEAKEDDKKALEHLRTLVKLLITNGETRKLLSDAKLIGRNVFADAASTVADRARPTEEELSKVDAATPQNQFKQETVESESKPDTETQANLASGVEGVPTGDMTQPERDIEGSIPSSKEPQATSKKTLKSRFHDLSASVPEKHKQAANNELENAKAYLAKQFPKERQDQFIDRLKKVVVECQEHPDYQESLSWFLSHLEKYFAHGKHVAVASRDQGTVSFFESPTLNQAASEMTTLLERLANGRSMEDMFDAVRNLQKDARSDEELRAWWSRADSFVRKSLLEPGFIVKPEFEDQGRQLHADSRKFFDVKYKAQRDALLDSVQLWFRAWSEDPLNKRLGQDASKLFKDLLFDAEGELAFKPHLWTDIRKVILPAAMKKIGYVPIPRVEYASKEIDVVVENITVQGRNFLPKIFELMAQNYIKASPYKEIGDQHHHEFTVILSQIQADMRDVAFYFRTKKGMRLSDSGLADVFLGGNGITIKAKLSSNVKERESGHLFKVQNVKVSIDALKFAIRDSKHDFLYRIVSKVGSGLIKRAISKAISDAIRSGLESADMKLIDIRDRMSEADASEDNSKTKVLRDMWSNRKRESSNSTKKSRRDSQLRIVPDRNSTLFPDQGHETGWVQKQYERDAAAIGGDGWKSKAFSIVPVTA